MLADPSQLDRWRRLLDAVATPAPPLDPATASDAIAHGHGRVLFRAILQTLNGPPDERLIARVGAGLPPSGPVPVRRPAGEGPAVAEAVWRDYFAWRLGHRDSADRLDAFARSLSPTALVFTIDDNPEPWWRSEMMILHALHSYALRSAGPDGDARHSPRDTLGLTLACADYHLQEIQPDHATNDPWAVHAYASHADGNVTAETLWHAAHVQGGGRPDAFARLLAADAAAALAVYLGK